VEESYAGEDQGCGLARRGTREAPVAPSFLCSATILYGLILSRRSSADARLYVRFFAVGKLSVFFTSFVKQPRAKKDFLDDGGDDDEVDEELDALDEMSLDGQDAEAGLPEERKGIKYMRQLVSRSTFPPTFPDGKGLHTDWLIAHSQTRIANRKKTQLVVELDDIISVRFSLPPSLRAARPDDHSITPTPSSSKTLPILSR
jgi:hypothetical protein